MKYFDKEMYACLDCKHKWILGSDKRITNEQHYKWLAEAIAEHEAIQHEEENK